MSTTAQFAEIAALAGDPTRACMLHALLDRRALTSSELAAVAGVAPQTASGHLHRMAAAGLLSASSQGRHRYYRLASGTVAEMLEAIMRVAAQPATTRRPCCGPRDPALRRARSCYDHLAGELSVALADALVRRGYLLIDHETAALTASGATFLAKMRVACDAGRGGSRQAAMTCRPCLDWSERRPHLAGRVGGALLDRCLSAGWLRRVDTSRALLITPSGTRVFRDDFGVELPAPDARTEVAMR